MMSTLIPSSSSSHNEPTSTSTFENDEAEVDHDDIEVEMDDDGTENYENNSGDENNNEGEEEEESASLPRRFLRSLLGNRKGHKSSEKDRSKLQISFDKSLPAAHSYLGDDLEDLRGRTILDEESVMTMPILLMPNIVLVPGQVIPLQLYQQRIVAMVRRAADGDKTFGVLNVRYSNEEYEETGRYGKTSDIGCTAEIFSMKDETDDLTGISMVRAKARGRQRFKVIGSLITEITGDISAKVRILPELNNTHVLDGAQLPSLRRFLIPHSSEDEESMVKTAVDQHGQVLMSVDLRRKHPINKLFAGHFTPWPPWVYKVYDIDWLSKQISTELESWCSKSLPKDPVELSYWVAHNLPVADKMRLELLSFDSVVQRLRFGLSIIRKTGVRLCCRVCRNPISNKKQVFSMSQEGPLGAFVNPGGHVHEMFTVLSAANMSYIGRASTEHSWFPGYAWTIIQCKVCHSHLGWMFTGTKRSLSPHKFWGLCRSSVQTVFSENDD